MGCRRLSLSSLAAGCCVQPDRCTCRCHTAAVARCCCRPVCLPTHPHPPLQDVDYINDRNAHFNRKIERIFGEHTAEIKANLERGELRLARGQWGGEVQRMSYLQQLHVWHMPAPVGRVTRCSVLICSTARPGVRTWVSVPCSVPPSPAVRLPRCRHGAARPPLSVLHAGPCSRCPATGTPGCASRHLMSPCSIACDTRMRLPLHGAAHATHCAHNTRRWPSPYHASCGGRVVSRR